MHLDLLPYELLQHISGCLLPRYQCRFALASKWHFQWLYNDLLRWHARKQHISLPQHTIIDHRTTFLITGNEFVIYLYDYELYIENLTTDITRFIDIEHTPYPHMCIANIPGVYIDNYICQYGIKIFDNKYKYMHSNNIKYCTSIHMSPLLSLPSAILEKILCFTEKNYDDLYDIHYYLTEVAYDA